MAFYKCDFNNDDSALGVVTITWWWTRIFKLINRPIDIYENSVLDKRHHLKAPGKKHIEVLILFPKASKSFLLCKAGFSKLPKLVSCMAQLSHLLIANSEFQECPSSSPNSVPARWLSIFLLIFLSVQHVEFSQFYTLRYFFAKGEISAMAVEYIKVVDNGFSFPGSAQRVLRSPHIFFLRTPYQRLVALYFLFFFFFI